MPSSRTWWFVPLTVVGVAMLMTVPPFNSLTRILYRTLTGKGSPKPSVSAEQWAIKFARPKSTTKPVALITGATSGLGLESARVLAKHAGFQVVLPVRDMAKAARIKADFIKEGINSADVHVMECDLGSFASVKAFSQAFLKSGIPAIDVLMLNAGMSPSGKMSKDGWEESFQATHFSHFLMYRLLESHLKQDTRIVIVSSVGHERAAPWDWPSPPTRKGFNSDPDRTISMSDIFPLYGLGKLANIYFSTAIAQKTGRTAVSVHPGPVATEIWTVFGYNIPRFIVDRVFWSVPIGTATQVWASLAPEVEAGGYYVPGPVKATPVTFHGSAKEDTERLWVESERIVGKFL